MTRLLKLSATALFTVLLVFLLSGCGGEEEPTQVVRTTTRSAARATGGASTGKAENLIGQTVTPTDLTPNDVKRALTSKRPVVILFYMSGPSDDNQVRSYVTSMESRFKGQVDFFTFLSSDAAKYGDLANLLQLNSTPTVVCINKQGQVVRAWTGYVDSDSLEQGVVETTK